LASSKGESMDRDQQERLYKAVNSVSLRLNNVELFEGITQCRQILLKYAEAASKIETRKLAQEIFDEAPNLSWKEEIFFRMACKYAPQLLRSGLKSFLISTLKDLPAPSGGRPRLLTDTEERAQVCDHISILSRKGVPLRDCYVRAGQKYTISERQAQRIWNERDSPTALDPTFEEVRAATARFINSETKPD
jgi:hypothetical protein